MTSRHPYDLRVIPAKKTVVESDLDSAFPITTFLDGKGTVSQQTHIPQILT